MSQGLDKLFIEAYIRLCDLHENIDKEDKLKISKMIFQIISMFEIKQRSLELNN